MISAKHRKPLLPVHLITIALMLLFVSTPASRAASPSLSSVLQTQEAQLSSTLKGYMLLSGPTDPTYYRNGVWYATDGPQCWYCYDTAAVGAATLGVLQDNTSLKQTAISTFSTAIAQHQLPNGAFANDAGVADQVATGFFAAPFGIAYLELRSVLPATTRQAWATSLADAANYLVSSGATTWYINGNVNLRQTEVLWLAYMATGESQYLSDYQSELSFTLDPSQTRWPGYGLHVIRNATNADGDGGAGYLAESNTGIDPGFDPNYTMAQLDAATDLYVLTHDHIDLYLMNLEYNQLAPLINRSDWVLNATGGARDSFMEPFLTGAVDVLAASGNRSDLASDVAPSLGAVDADYRQAALNAPNVNYYKSVECAFAIPLLNAEWPNGLDAAAGTTSTSSPSAIPVLARSTSARASRASASKASSSTTYRTHRRRHSHKARR